MELLDSLAALSIREYGGTLVTLSRSVMLILGSFWIQWNV